MIFAAAEADSGKVGGAPEPNLRIKLHVYNYAEVPKEKLNQAQRTLARIFGQMDVRVWFQQDSISLKNNSRTSGAALSSSSSELKLWISLLPRERAKAFRSLNLTKDAFGFTPVGKDQPGQRAYLFVDRIKDLGRNLRNTPGRQNQGRYLRYVRSEGQILGHFIAHEVGHMFLPPNSHWVSGIMRAKWERGVLDQIGGYCQVGDGDGDVDLLFTPRESELIRKGIDARIKQQKDLDLEELEN